MSMIETYSTHALKDTTPTNGTATSTKLSDESDVFLTEYPWKSIIG